LRKLEAVRYVAFLRGINVGGKALIRMAELRECVEEVGHEDVATYIASGNVLFSSPSRSPAELERPLERAIERRFRLDVRVFVRSARQLAATARAIPEHWLGNDDLRCNVIFVAREIDRPKLVHEFDPKPEIEELARIPGALLWAARRSALTRSTMLRLAQHPLYDRMTARNPTTVLALAKLVSQG
jgi:uncharacterized protein (DUF1697 family)